MASNDQLEIKIESKYVTYKLRCGYCFKERYALRKARAYSIYDGILLCGLCYSKIYESRVKEPIPE
jgi:hypothetical protein